MSLFHLCLLVLLSVLWGGAFTLAGYAVEILPPVTVVVLRVALAAPVLWGVILCRGERMPTGTTVWGAFFLLGALNNALPFYLITWGQTRIDSGMAAVLNGATPLFGAVLAHFLTGDEKLGLRKAFGLMLGLAGVVLLVGPNLALDPSALMGQAAVLLAAFSYACSGMIGKRLGGYSALSISTGQLTMSSLILLPMTWYAGGFDNLPPDPGLWGALMLLAVFSTALAYILYFHLIAKSGATNAMSVTLLVPVVAMILGVLLLGEAVDPLAIGAAALVLVGVGLVIRKPAPDRPGGSHKAGSCPQSQHDLAHMGA